MNSRRYYSRRRQQLLGGGQLDLERTKSMALAIFEDFRARRYFDEYFGYTCVDAGEVPGLAGQNVERFFRVNLCKNDLWPLSSNLARFGEEDLFDVLELLYDNVSKPVDGRYHDFCDCGWHYDTFDKAAGQAEYRDRINGLLQDYQDGYVLSADGAILHRGPQGIGDLLESPLPGSTPERVTIRVQAAIEKFRARGATIDDRRDAVRSLVDAFEYLRDDVRSVLSNKDEADLFNIANNFGLRHYNAQQKLEYDQGLWLPWMFYFYLATLHTTLNLIRTKTISKEEDRYLGSPR